MAWKKTVLADYDEKGIADNQTIEIVKLPQAIISAIYIRLSGTGGAGTPAVDNLISNIKIKTDKGYIFDMDSADLHTLAKFISGQKPKITNATSAYSETNHHIYFGHYPKDKEYMLDLTKSVARQMELTFGTLIGNNAFASGTVRLTITIEEWIGENPAKGFISPKTVESKATGTGLATFELFTGNKLYALLIHIGTPTTVRQVTVGNKSQSIIWAKANFRDLLNTQLEDNFDTFEGNYAFLKFMGKDPVELPLLNISDPCVLIERGTTTTTSKVIQLDVYE